MWVFNIKAKVKPFNIDMVNKQLVPCFIKKILKVSVVDSASTNPTIIQNLVFLYLSKLVEYSQKRYFGHPIQIWQYYHDFNDTQDILLLWSS